MEYKKLSVFDFDGTMVKTPEPTDENKQKWETFYGKKWPYIGWWGRAESLDTKVWSMEPKSDVLKDYKNEISNKNTMTILLTGRMEKLRPQVEHILTKNNLKFDKILLNQGESTVIDKINQITKILKNNPSITELELWDDRDEHIPIFQKWGETLKPIKFKINHIK